MGSDPQEFLQVQYEADRREHIKEINRLTNPPLPEFLDWCANRFVEVYDESPNTDFVQALRRVSTYLKQT